MDFDLTTPEGIRALQKHLKKLPAAEALRFIRDNQTRAGDELFTRSMSGIRMVEGEQRTFDVSFSSEEPVKRYFGNEVLSHDDGAVDLRWINSGNAPTLWMHDPKTHIGVVKSATQDSKAKRCDARCQMANDHDGDHYMNRVSGGIIRNTSVGYSIQEWERIDDPTDEDAPPTYRATKWKPHEVSLVSTPADETVGVGRCRTFSLPDPDTKTIPITPKLPTRTTMLTAEQTAEQEKLVAESAKRAAEKERKRISAITLLRMKYDADGSRVSEAEFSAILGDESKGELEFRQLLEAKNATQARVSPSGVIVTRAEEDGLPLLHRLRGLVFGGESMKENWRNEDSLYRKLSPACFKPSAENERSLVTSSGMVRSTRFLPVDPEFQRAQNAQSLAAGGALVGVTFAPEIIDYLRPMPQMQKAGAVILSGVSGGPGTIRFPKQTGDIYAQWAAAGVASTPNQLPFGVLDLTPKRLVAQVRIDKQLLLQESFDIEAYVRNSINLQFALSYDLAGLIGNGNGMPLGILNTPNIQAGAVTFNGPSASSGTLAPQYNNFLLFRQLVLAANAGGLGKRTFISSPQSIINWAGVPKATPAATQTVNDKWMLEFGQNGKEYSVLGEEALETTYLNTLPTAYQTAGFTLPTPDVVIYGPFSQYMFIEWAGIEWIYDPYTQAASDLIVLTARLYADGGCKQPTAFVTSSNAGSVNYV